MKNGIHQNGFKYRNRRNNTSLGRNSIIGVIATAITGSIVKDLTSDSSKIISFFRKTLHITQVENKQVERKVIDADYSIENGNSTESDTKKLK